MRTMSLLTPHYYPGEVYFKDGHVEEYAELELPRVGKHKSGGSMNESPVCFIIVSLFAGIGKDRCTLCHFHPSRELCHHLR